MTLLQIQTATCWRNVSSNAVNEILGLGTRSCRTRRPWGKVRLYCAKLPIPPQKHVLVGKHEPLGVRRPGPERKKGDLVLGSLHLGDLLFSPDRLHIR